MTDFILGCNYWASNAGTDMWRNFDEKAIRKDLDTLSKNGVTHLRVFPNWADFQPAKYLYGIGGIRRDIVHENGNYFENETYTDEKMMDRFSVFLDICEEYNLKLIVAILTGWMSGRLFAPRILEEKNLYTDSLALRLEQKFIKAIVSSFKNRKCIIAWGIGNECNCLGTADRDEAAAWTGNVVNAIKACDSSRPVISDMHGLGVANEWRIKDQAEHCDFLTTHPYPDFVPHCLKDGLSSFRTFMHAPCENKYYEEIGGKPCFTEEIGTLGPMNANDELASIFLRISLYHAYINKQNGFMWWCACEQSHLNEAPYQWSMMERELGLMDSDGNPRKTLKTIKEVKEKFDSYDFELSAPEKDIVCITTSGQDNWGVSYMAYSIARQAGLNLKFAYSEYEIPECEYYMLPSVCGDTPLPKRKYFELKERVFNGATLYVSNDCGYFSEFSDFFGLEVLEKKIVTETCDISLNGETFKLERYCRRIVKETKANVLARDNHGTPALTVHKYGQGKVYFLNFPLEKSLLEKEDAFSENYGNIYKFVFKDILDKKTVTQGNKNVGITYHKDKIALINYTSESQTVNLSDGRDITIAPYEMEII